MTDVVVRQVLADRLELGTQPERPAGALPGIAKTALPHGEHEAVRVHDVGVHDDLGGLLAVEEPASEPERAGAPRGHGRQLVATPTPAQQRGVEARLRDRRLDHDVGRLRLAHGDVAAIHTVGRDRHGCRDSARDDAGQCASQPRLAPGDREIDEPGADQDPGEHEGDDARNDEGRECDGDEHVRGARGRGH